MMKRCAAAVLAIFLTCSAWAQIAYRGTTQVDIEALYKQAKSEADAAAREEEGYMRITVPSKHTIYYFTTPKHPCHPAVVIQRIFEKSGAVWIEANGLTAGDQAKFEQWLRVFERQHEQIKSRMRSRNPGS
jgi:hypothetical protein